MIETVPLGSLRAYAVRQSLFAPTSLPAAIAAMGFVQLDPIRAPARAADLILRHRVAGYRAGDLDRAYPDLPLVEDYLHVYGVMPAPTQDLLHPRPPLEWRVDSEHPRLAARVLAHVRARGVTHPRDLHVALGKDSIRNGWGGSSAATTRMLEALQYRGKLRVARREGGIRLYALAEARPRPRAVATRADDVLALLLRLYAPLPEGSLRKLARMVAGISIPEDVAARTLARMLDGQVSAVVGTHTHVQTADEQIFPGGTAYLSDAGFTGPQESVLGREIQPVLLRSRTAMPQRFEVARNDVKLHGAVVEIDEATGKALKIQRVSEAI